MPNETKHFTPPMILVLCITVVGWVYSSGVLSEKVTNLTKKATTNSELIAISASKVVKIDVMQNDIKHIKLSILELKAQQRDNQSEMLKAIRHKTNTN